MGIFGPKQEKQYYPSGKLLASYYVGKEGNPEGAYREYYENGKLEAEGAILDNRKEGLWHFFYDDGRLQAKGEFNRGFKNGTWEYNGNKLPKSISWSIYIGPNSNFGINYPSSWQIQVQEDINLFAAFENTAIDEYGSNFSVLFKNLEHPIVLEEYVPKSVNEQIRKAPQQIDLTLPISNQLEINNMEAYYSVMQTLNTQKQPINFIQFYILNGLTLFVVNFFCLESKIPEFEKIFDEIVFSFRSPF